MQTPVLLDTTLRDGEQSAGLYFTNREKIQIAQTLDRIGIDIIEAGIPSMGEEERSYLGSMIQLGLKAEILAWNRLLIEDVTCSLQTGLSNIHVSVPTSNIMLEKKICKSRQWVFSQMKKVISFAVREGARVSVGAEDASRSDPAFLKEVFVAARELGAHRVRFADTLGTLTPSETHTYVRYLVDGLGVPLDFHGHNDFGMATANALAAWEAGAGVISCSLLGLGERAGNTPLEEFTGVLHYLKNELPDFDFVTLKTLCKKISSWTGIPIPERKPLFGSSVYRHESGIHVDGILKEPSTYEFFPPEQLGEQRTFVLGKHSGRQAIRHLAGEKGFQVTDSDIEAFLENIRRCMARDRGIDVARLFQQFLDTRDGKYEHY